MSDLGTAHYECALPSDDLFIHIAVVQYFIMLSGFAKESAEFLI